MISKKVLFVSLLLVVLTASNFAQKPDSNYTHNCNETETSEFISTMRNIISESKNRYYQRRLVVLSDTETKIYEPLRQKLIAEDSLFVSLHKTFNSMEETFRTASIVRYISHVKFIIHSNTVDNAVSIFEKLTSIYSNTILFHGNIAIVFTKLSENGDKYEEMMWKKMEDFARQSKNENIMSFLEQNRKLPIVTFSNEISSSNQVTDFVTNYKNDNIENQETYLFAYSKFNFEKDYQERIDCGIKFVNERISEKMEQYSKNLESSLRDLEVPKKSGSMQNIWSIVKSNTTNDVENYLKGFLNCLENVEEEWKHSHVLSFVKTNATKHAEDSFNKFLGCFKNIEYQWMFSELDDLKIDINTIDFLSYYAKNSSQLSIVALDWTKPLRSYSEQYLKNLHNMYYRTEQGQLFPRKVVQICNATENKEYYKMYVTGYVVKLSDLDLHSCAEEPKVIEIFAVERVIIDIDIDLIGKKVQMSIIAPTWEVISSDNEGEIPGRRLINLSGSNGTNIEEQHAKNGTTRGNRNGAHGLAGKPGGPAGIFYGIADNIINAEKLTILANGGDGGNGQHGGHGAEGADGMAYNGVPEIECGRKLNGWYNFEKFYEYFVRQEQLYVISGRTGKLGGRGGNGGIGGMKGKKGIITIKELSNCNKRLIQSSATDGKTGSGGIGGEAGLGGKNGNTVIYVCIWTRRTPVFKSEKETIENTGRGKMGLKGETGISLKRRSIADSLQTTYSFSSEINKYKIYIRTYLADSNFTEKYKLWAFYDSLNTHENITKMYDTLSLVEDFIELEKQFFSLNKKMNFTLSYEQLKKRIDTYAENPHKEENTAEYRNIIKDLKTDIKDRLASVKSINSYYDVNTEVQNQPKRSLLPLIRKLENFRTTNNKLLLLKKKIFLLDDAMKSGEKLIIEVAHTAIADMEETLDQELDSLLREISEMEEKALDNEKELIKNREELQKTMQLKALFGAFKIACGVLGIINPALGFAGALAVSALTVIEAKTTGDAEAKAAVIPKSIESLATASENYFKILKEKQEKIIKEQEKYIEREKQSKKFDEKDIINQVWYSAQTLREIDHETGTLVTKGYSMMQVYNNQEIKLTEDLKKIEDDIKRSNNTEDKRKEFVIKTGLKVAKYLKVTSEAFKTGSESAISIIKDEGKIAEIDVALNKSLKTLETLNLLEKSIYTTVEPMLNDMKTNLDEVKRDIGNMNEFKQAIAKWNVTRTIDDIKRTLTKATKDFKVNDDINWTLGELIKTFDLLFEQHKLLFLNKDKQRDKIDETNLHIAHASNLLISDSKLRYALSELQVVSMSNFVAEKYHEWISAFKQFAFPYIGDKLEKLENLDTFREDGITQFANFIINNIENIIENAHSTIFTDQKHKVNFRGTNFHDERSMFSFYTWKNVQNKQAIYNILNGNETTLVADIHNSDFHAEAVKFNRVKLLFTTAFPIEQEELNKELNNFDVKLTHHGNSKYEYKNFIYEFKNNPTLLTFNYDINYEERETHLVSRLANGPYLLSPYATWTIQLSPIQKNRKFDSLQKFKDIVDLELIGNGEYTNNTVCDSTCENAMQKYYTISNV